MKQINQSGSVDADTTYVEEILRGASRGPMDPDIELAEILIQIDRARGRDVVRKSLEQLARDARSH